VIDSQQRLWVVAPGLARLALVDTVKGTLVNSNIVPPSGTTCGAYAIGVDGKDRIWLPGWAAGSLACRYDHGPGTSNNIGAWTSFNFSSARTSSGRSLARPRGIAVDEEGKVYMSADYLGSVYVAQLIRFDAENGTLLPIGGQEIVEGTDSSTNHSIGVGLDADGHPWVNNNSGNVMRVHKTTGEVLRSTKQEAGLYTYSDFTGYQLRKFTAPRGTYRKDLEGCELTRWDTLTFDAALPPNTSVEVYLSAADSRETLTGSTRFGPYSQSPVNLQDKAVPDSRYLRLEFVLSSTDGKATPILKSFNVSWTCLSSGLR
jgi:hypothetical protein